MRQRRLLPEDRAYFGCLHAIWWQSEEPSGEKTSSGESGVSQANTENVNKINDISVKSCAFPAEL